MLDIWEGAALSFCPLRPAKIREGVHYYLAQEGLSCCRFAGGDASAPGGIVVSRRGSCLHASSELAALGGLAVWAGDEAFDWLVGEGLLGATVVYEVVVADAVELLF